MENRKANVKRISFLKVPLDILPRTDFEDTILTILKDPNPNQIILVRILDLLKARRDKELLECMNNAALVLPMSKRIIAAAKFLKLEQPFFYDPFEFTIQLLGTLEKYNKSVYLLGAGKKNIQISANNLRPSFPNLKIVGKYSGHYPRDVEKDILLAIKKASPSLLLLGSGIPGKNKWFSRNKKYLNPGIGYWNNSCFEIFAGKKKKKPGFGGLLLFFLQCLFSPWMWIKGLIYFYYSILLLIYRIRKNRSV